MVNINDIFKEENEDKRKELVNERLKAIDSMSKQNALINTQTNYRGFISSTSRILFSDYLIYIGDSCSQAGYTMKTQDYIPLFIEYVKSKKINDINQIIMSISPFLHEYFGCNKDYTNTYNRDDTFDEMGRRLGEIKEQSDEKYEYYYNKWFDIGSFKDGSMAECSEYASLAQNILSFLGIESYYVSGYLNNEGDHAYNIINLKGKAHLMDFANPIILYDEKFNIITSQANHHSLSDEEFNSFKEGNELYVSFTKCNYQFKDNKSKPIDHVKFSYMTNSKRNNFRR